MPFLNPIVFWTALGAASIPVMIHLLNRRRFRMMDWAAMKFLMESVRKNRRRLRIEELILLAMRCLIVLLLGVALARFTGCQAMSALPGGTESRSVVFVLDDSYSMGQRVGGGTIFSAAATDLADQLADLPATDKVAILRTSDVGDRPFFKPTHVANAEIETLASRLTALEPTDRRADLAAALEDAGRMLRDDPATVRRVVVYSDFRLADLAGRDNEDLRKAFDDLRAAEIELAALDFGRDAKSNLTVTRLEMLDKFALADVPTRLRMEVRNHGAAMVRDVEVRLAAEVGTPEGLREVQIPAGTIESIDRRAAGRLEFSVTCPQAGPAFVTAQLPADELPADNAAHLALDVREAVRVLIVDGRSDPGDPTASEAFFLRHALDPEGDGSTGTEVETIAPASLADAAIEGYDLVILADVPELPPVLDANGTARYPEVEALEAFVRGGGGLALFTGEQVNVAFYNDVLYDEGTGLSPLRLGPRRGTADRRDAFFRLDPQSIAASPILRSFREFLEAGVDPTRLVRFHAFHTTNPATPPAPSDDVRPPRILAKFADEDASAAVVSRQVGKGTVVAVYSTASMRWNDWAADEIGTYVAFVNDLATYLARPQPPEMSARVGTPITWALPPGFRDARATLKTPRHPVEPVVPLAAERPEGAQADENLQLRYDRAAHAGRYTLELKLPDATARTVLFARSVDPAEGDLACGREAALAAALGSDAFTYVDHTRARAAVGQQAEARKEYWTWALAALAVLLALETFLGQRFGHYRTADRGRGS